MKIGIKLQSLIPIFIYCFSAEKQGFEPWEQLPVHRISSAARDIALKSVQAVYQSIIYHLFKSPESLIYEKKKKPIEHYLEVVRTASNTIIKICRVEPEFQKMVRNQFEGWEIRSSHSSFVSMVETVWNSEESSQGDES